MSDERSTPITWLENPSQESYDKSYYDILLPLLHGAVLDLGCGIGMMTDRIAKIDTVYELYAIDKFPMLQRIYDTSFVRSIKQNITEGFDLGRRFDCINSTEFIEHITKEDFLKLLPIIKQHLRDGCLFCGSTPNKKRPTTNPYHLYEYTLEELKEILEANFSELEIYDNGRECLIWIAKL